MYSAYLNKDIELTEKSATMEGGKKQTIVSHSELENFILTDLRGKVRFEYPVVIPSLTDAVVTCRMWDDGGNHIVAMGEATQDTRNSKVADCYPTTTAANRAFDRAAIRFLGLGKVYSDLEIAPDGPKRYDDAKLNDAPATSMPIEDQTQETRPVPTSRQTPSVENNAPSEQTPPVQGATTQKTLDDGAVVISIGKYAGKNKTIAEICLEDLKWLQYIATLSAKKDDVKTQVESVKRYLEAQEGK